MIAAHDQETEIPLNRDVADLSLDGCAAMLGATEGFLSRLLTSVAIDEAAPGEEALIEMRGPLLARYDELAAVATPLDVQRAVDLRELAQGRAKQSADGMEVRALLDLLEEGVA